MTCPVCGKEPPCTHDRKGAVLLAAHSYVPEDFPLEQVRESDDPHWRDEVASRVQRHRARRRGDAGSEAAMEFDFPPAEAQAVTEEPVVRYRFKRTREPDPVSGADERSPAFSSEPKIIRFPRTHAAAATSPYLQPEEPFVEPKDSEPLSGAETEVFLEPRIMEVAEPELPAPQPRVAQQLDLLPSFEDIHLEPVHTRVIAGPEIIPHPASLQQRSIAAIVDVSAVVIAAALFDFTFVRLAEDDPHSRMALLCGLGVTAILWILFQYLFLVYGKGTPGMRFADLELATFEGKPASPTDRRCRALASMLSAFSLGFGYAWALIDEDQLGWHDRITGTLVRASGAQPTDKNEIWE